MRKLTFFTFIVLLISSCQQKEDAIVDNLPVFQKELNELKNYFHIPGLQAILLKENQVIFKENIGYADLENQVAVDDATLFPVASLTKIYASVLIMKLVEEGKLSLETPIKTYFPNLEIDDSILVKHILSHTSQGEVGKDFYYSSRFGMLTKVIEQASGKSFKEYFEQEITKHLSLKNTFLLEDTTQILTWGERLAQPYVYEEEVRGGFIDYGYSAAAGVVANATDLASLSIALNQNTLITKESKNKLFSPFIDSSPYGLGIFSQIFKGKELIWGYGQYDCYSSLFLQVPEKDITLILLANNNFMSDPARLIYGDVTTSLFALSFLKNFVFQVENISLLEPSTGVITDSIFFQRSIQAKALSESFLAQFDVKKYNTGTFYLRKLAKDFPEDFKNGDLNTMHTIAFLKNVAFYREIGEFNDYDADLISIGNQLLDKDEYNPYANVYLGNLYARKGDADKARYHFKKITEAENFSKNWYTYEALNWLNQNPIEDKVE